MALQRRAEAEGADPVRDEVGGVLGPHDALAQHAVGEAFDRRAAPGSVSGPGMVSSSFR